MKGVGEMQFDYMIFYRGVHCDTISAINMSSALKRYSEKHSVPVSDEYYTAVEKTGYLRLEEMKDTLRYYRDEARVTGDYTAYNRLNFEVNALTEWLYG